MGTKKAKTSVKAAGDAAAEKPDRKLTRATLMDLYAARRYLALDTLKETVPIWKREHWGGGSDWATGDHPVRAVTSS